MAHDPSRPVRYAIIDFDKTQFPFFLKLAQRLAGVAEFHFFQLKLDTLHLLDGQTQAQLWRGAARWSAAATLSDDEVLQAAGLHELLWCASVPKLIAQSRELIARLGGFFQACAIDCVLIFNGAQLARSLAVFVAQRLGLPCRYLENGYLPGTMQLDGAGVNAYSSHTAAVAQGCYRDFEPDDALLDRALDWLRSGRRPADVVPLPRFSLPLRQRLRREIDRLLSPKAWQWLQPPARGRFHDRLPADADDFVLLPMQVVRDSQLSLHSPLVGYDLERLILVTYRAMRCALPGRRLVVKLHPKETQHVNRRYRRLAARLPDVLFLQRQPIHEVLARCALVVTVNSTVGVEALALGKPAVTLGRNFYTTRPLVEPVGDLEALPQALQAALRNRPDAALVRRFLGYVQQRMHVPGSFLDLSERSQQAVAAALLGPP